MGMTIVWKVVILVGILISSGHISLLLITKSTKLGHSVLEKLVEPALFRTYESGLNDAQENVPSKTSYVGRMIDYMS